ncbi:hypothetical protein AB205_0180630, partial [Aquarana catesbeiana]
WCTQYLIQCSVVLHNKIYIMSGRPPRRGRRSQATKRGQAASVSTVNSGRGARLSFFSAAGCVIEPEHAEESLEWITKHPPPPLSPRFRVVCLPMQLPKQPIPPAPCPVTPSVAPPSCTEESPELFDHSVGYILLEDEQQF